MNSLLKKAWVEIVDPLIRRPKRVQVAALCYRTSNKSGKEILLITSMNTGRWIIPKGWPIDGLDARGAAAQEAWEEAGVVDGKVGKKPIGSFEYTKHFVGGGDARCKAKVFEVAVDELADDFPEKNARKRIWVAPKKAAEMVEEPELQDMLRQY